MSVRPFIFVVAVCALGQGHGAGRSGATPLSRDPVPTFRRPFERIASFDPLRASSVTEAAALTLVYETPLEVDYYARPYKLRPGLFDLPAVSADGLVYTFTLRGSSRFRPDPCFGAAARTGRPVTAQDAVYSLERLADRANASSGMWIMDGVAKCEAPDARTLRVTLKKPLHVFAWLMSMPYAAVLPREAVERYGVKFGSHPVGSGPYALVEWRRNHSLTFTRDVAWPGWTRGDDAVSLLADGTPATGAFVERVEYLVVDDESTRWLMYLGGGLDHLSAISNNNWDAVVGPDGELVPELAARGARLHSFAGLQLFYLGINMTDPVLGPNKKLRQALNAAFDFPAWRRFLNGRGAYADSPVPPGVDGKLETPFAYGFDLEKAKRLLAEAGYPGGVDPKTGRRLEISLTLGRATQDAREQAELLASFYARVGVRLSARYMTWDAYLKAVNDGNVSIFFLGWVGDYPDAENFLQLFHSKNVSPGANHGNYKNPAFDRLYDEAMATRDEGRRLELWRQAQEIVREDCPWIFLHFPRLYSLSKTHVQGYRPGDFPYCTEKHLRLAR